MYKRKYTPEFIDTLSENEVFVFGSNLMGHHIGGAARVAHENFGAVWGKGVGLQGQSYAIPTMEGGVETIKPYVDDFIAFAKENINLTFYVTRIGCGIAGFKDSEIAPLFKGALSMENIILPESFVHVIEATSPTSIESSHTTRRKSLKYMFYVTILGLLVLAGYVIYWNSFDEYNDYTPEIVYEGSGIDLGEYQIIKKIDDKHLHEDGWGNLVWHIKLKTPISDELLFKLAENDKRWEFQDDIRQQFFFFDGDSLSCRNMFIGKGEDPIISVSYDWKKRRMR